MKIFVLVSAVALAAAVPAHAQTSASPAEPSASPAQTSSPPAPPAAGPDAAGGQPSNEASDPASASGKIRALRKSCQAETEAKGLKGDDKRKAVSACVVQARPDLAARETCRLKGFDLGLRKEGLKRYVKDCLHGQS